MTLQQENVQVTDVEIAERFHELYNAIRAWIQGVQQDLRQDGWSFKDFQQELQDEPGRSNLMDILRRREDTYREKWNYTASEIRWATWLGKHSTCHDVVLSLAIWSCLEKKIFCSPFPPGVQVTGDAKETVRDIMLMMKTADDGGGAFIYSCARYS